MKKFEGFPAKMQFTSIPNLFFSELMPQIADMAELRVTLHIFRLLYMKRGSPVYVTFHELLSDSGIVESLESDGLSPELKLESVLKQAVERGTFLSLEFDTGRETEVLYFANTEKGRDAVEKIRDGSLLLDGLALVRKKAVSSAEKPPDIFRLYEENVGMITPLIAEWIKEAETQYPESWIREAIEEAVSMKKRNWRYIEKILENWSAEGREDGKHRRHTETGSTKYGKQKFGHIIRH